jgi:hypothetical protein
MRMLLAVVLTALSAQPVIAGPNEAENAVTNILFEEGMENASYGFRGDGFVDILFGPAVPEDQYIRIVEKIRSHPDVPGVLAGRGKSNFCSVP